MISLRETYKKAMMFFAKATNDYMFDVMFNVLCEKMTSRPYHNLTHILNIIVALEEHTHELSEEEYWKMVLAAFYHDYVYDIHIKTNEVNSAVHFSEEIKKVFDLPRDVTQQVSDIIIGTKSNPTPTNDYLVMLFRDLDYKTLGSSWKEYNNNSKKIRKEYKEFGYFKYRIGRKKFIMQQLEQENIFSTKEYIEKYDKIARNNLKKELKWIWMPLWIM